MWPSLVKIRYTDSIEKIWQKSLVWINFHWPWATGPLLKSMIATWLPCGRGRTLFILGLLPLYRLIIYIDGRILWCTHFLLFKMFQCRTINKTKVIVRKRSCCQKSIYSNGDLDLWPNDPKINRVFPLPQGNHVAKFGKDSTYRTKVIVRKPVWTPARHTQSHFKVICRNSSFIFEFTFINSRMFTSCFW
jgi:hypothetical protein